MPVIQFWLDQIFNKSIVIIDGRKWYPCKLDVPVRQHFFVTLKSGHEKLRFTYSNNKGKWERNKCHIEMFDVNGCKIN